MIALKETVELVKKDISGIVRSFETEGFDKVEPKLNSLYERVASENNKWLSRQGLSSIFVESIINNTDAERIRKRQTGTRVSLTDGEIEKTVNEMVETIKGIPYDYEIKFPLSNTVLPEDIQFNTTGISFQKNKDASGSLSRALKGPAPQSWLVINASGFLTDTSPGSVYEDALSKFKKILYLAYLTKSASFVDPKSYFATVKYFNVEILNIKAAKRFSYYLGEPLNKVLSKIQFEDLSTPSFRKQVNEIISFVSLESDDKKRINLSLEWAFDSLSAGNMTTTFIHKCIALEALLGDDVAESGLTATLSDRCAYLIGRTDSQRKKIRSQFRDLYKMRSKVMHGISRIKAKDRLVFTASDALLNELLLKEYLNITKLIP